MTQPHDAISSPATTPEVGLPEPPVTDREAIAALARDLDAANYRVEAVEELLGSEASDALFREQPIAARGVVATHVAPWTKATHEKTELVPAPNYEAEAGIAALISAFMLGDAVPATLLDAALPETQSAGLTQLNLGATRNGIFYPHVDLSPYANDMPGHLWVASDQTALQRRAPLAADHVLGIGQASLTLAALVPRDRVALAADIGTGCGIQSLHLLAHADHVIATDISTRALDFTRFNILLNADTLEVDPENLDARITLTTGNMLDPLTQNKHRVDLLVTNPPFVISPPSTGKQQTDDDETRYVYRETGHTGDGLMAELVSTASQALAENGQAVMLGNWEITPSDEQPEREAWKRKLDSWAGEDLDIWAIQRDVQKPTQYAETWLADSSMELDPAKYEARYQQYVADFAARDVAEIGFGWVWLRRRPELQDEHHTDSLRRFEELTGPVEQPVGPWWAASIKAWDRIHRPDETKQTDQRDTGTWPLASAHLVVPHHITEERVQHFGAENPEVILARSGAGFCRSTVLDTAVAGFLAAADGELPAGALVEALVNLLELSDEAHLGLHTRIEDLVVDGYLDWAEH